MAEKISVEIGLEGGAQVEQGLESILKTGEKTFSGLQQAADQLDFSSVADDFQNVGNKGQEALNKIQAAVQSTAAFEQLIQGVKKVEGAFDALGTAATKMATRMSKSLGVFGVLARSFGPLGIAVGIAAGAFVKFGNDSAKALENLTTEGAKLGLTAQQFDRVQQAFGKLGVPADAITASMEKLKGVFSEGGLMRLGDIAPPEVTAGLQQLIAALAKMPDGVKRTQAAVAALGEELGGKVVAGLQTGKLGAEQFAQALASATPATQEQINQANQYKQALNGLNSAWTEFKTNLTGPVLTPGIEWLTTQLPGITAGIATTVREFKALWDIINTIGTAGASVIAALVAPIELVINAVQRLAAAFSTLKPGGTPLAGGAPIGGAGGGIGSHASGGLLGGRGTGTSDSNLAWVSRGEHIMPARAVGQPGVLSFLEALRRSGGNLSRVLDGMGRFALGGLVPRAIPAYAAGGLTGGSNVTIQFPGLQPISGLRASSSVVDQLHKAAALAQVRSGGRKPSRYS